MSKQLLGDTLGRKESCPVVPIVSDPDDVASIWKWKFYKDDIVTNLSSSLVMADIESMFPVTCESWKKTIFVIFYVWSWLEWNQKKFNCVIYEVNHFNVKTCNIILTITTDLITLQTW